jgi:hypothetical protein
MQATKGKDQMRWDNLFGDLEAQAESLEAAQRMREVEERARIETAQLHLLDRLRAAVGLSVRLRLVTGAVVDGELTRVGGQWVLISELAGRQALVPLSGVASVSGLGRLAAAPNSQGVIESRLGLTHVLRAIARDRSAVRVELIGGAVIDGTIDRVGADFVELATHAAGVERRHGDVREVLLVAVSALSAIRRDNASPY